LLDLHNTHGLPHIAFSSIPLPKSIVLPLNLPSPPDRYTALLPRPLPLWYEALGTGDPEDDILVCFASSMVNSTLQTWAYALPTVQGYFSGVGDLFSAMVLAHFEPQAPRSLGTAVSKALLIVQQILLKTHLHSLSQAGTSGSATPRPLHSTQPALHSVIPSDSELDSHPSDPKRKAKRMRLRELRVVQERDILRELVDGWPGLQVDWDAIL
jgi:pyridoxine kinase